MSVGNMFLRVMIGKVQGMGSPREAQFLAQGSIAQGVES